MPHFTSLSDAIATHVESGLTVCLEGFTHLIPFAAGYEIIRQGVRDLTLVRMTPDLIYDRLIGMGCARKAIFSWCGNLGVGGAPEIASLAKETLFIIKHSPRTLVERVDFITSAGYLDGGDAREKVGLKGGPAALITDAARAKQI